MFTKKIIILCTTLCILANSLVTPIVAMKRGRDDQPPTFIQMPSKSRKLVDHDEVNALADSVHTMHVSNSVHAQSKKRKLDEYMIFSIDDTVPNNTQNNASSHTNSTNTDSLVSTFNELSLKKPKTKDFDDELLNSMKQLTLTTMIIDFRDQTARDLLEHVDSLQLNKPIIGIIISDSMLDNETTFKKLLQFIATRESIVSIQFDHTFITQDQYNQLLTCTLHSNKKVYETIQELSFLRCEGLTNDSLKSISHLKKLIFSCPNTMHQFMLSDCKELEDLLIRGTTLSIELSNLPKLKNIATQDIYIIQSFKAHGCNNIEHISLHDTIINPTLLNEIATSCGNFLKQLVLVNPLWTVPTSTNLKEIFPKLEHLYCKEKDLLTNNGK